MIDEGRGGRPRLRRHGNCRVPSRQRARRLGSRRRRGQGQRHPGWPEPGRRAGTRRAGQAGRRRRHAACDDALRRCARAGRRVAGLRRHAVDSARRHRPVVHRGVPSTTSCACAPGGTPALAAAHRRHPEHGAAGNRRGAGDPRAARRPPRYGADGRCRHVPGVPARGLGDRRLLLAVPARRRHRGRARSARLSPSSSLSSTRPFTSSISGSPRR